ncbi:phage polarity suppression protein [Buttiauxella noackiae]|uniref:phage polarity suppression protein n=1 Tax=Buttiauxella noackiae TaxID=82992 RepID=UPI0005593DC6|nr:phage polarity suppression protein [Buttiauxella noackiae]
MSDTILDVALTAWRDARKAWQDKSTHYTDTQKQLSDQLSAAIKPADYDKKVVLLREELAVTVWEVAVAADTTRAAHAGLKATCIREALKTFMATNGEALTDALYPYIKGSEGLEPAMTLLHDAVLAQIASREPQVLTAYSAALTEAGMSLEEAVWKDSGANYTTAGNYTFQLRREALNKQNSIH